MNNQIVPFEEIQQIGSAMVRSGYFADSKDVNQAIVKILAGRELGLGEFASMSGIHIISGKPALGANLLASLIKNDPRYNYKVKTMTDQECSIDFFERWDNKWDLMGNSSFTAADAKKAGTKNMDKFPRNMLFARAISNGAKWYAPGIFGGAPVYTPEELGADVDIDGNIIDVTPTVTRSTNNAERIDQPQAWPGELIDKVLAAYPTLKARKHVVNTLDKSNLKADCMFEDMKRWLELYRQSRNEDNTTSDEAAKVANDNYNLEAAE